MYIIIIIIVVIIHISIFGSLVLFKLIESSQFF